MWFFELGAKYGSVLTGVRADRVRDTLIACVRAAKLPKNGNLFEIQGKGFVASCSLGEGYGGTTFLEVFQKK